MTAVPVLLGAPGLPGEPELVTALTRPGVPVQVVRRCVDAVDLLGAAAGGRARVAVVGAGLPRLARETVVRLEAAHLRVVGVAAPDDDTGRRRLRDLDLPVVTLPLDDVDSAVLELARAIDDPRSRVQEPSAHVEPASNAGRLVAVWGPTGAPGRTTVAIGLSDELSRDGTASLLVDADTYGGSVATRLGLLEDAAGIVVACRHADSGHLDEGALATSARALADNWRLVTGIPRADRWAELRPSSLRRLWDACRELAGVTVADVGFSLEADEELLGDARTPRRNGATLSALAASDVIVAVGSADPVGMERLIGGLGDLRRIRDDAPVVVVVNRVRRGLLGRDTEGQVREALARHGGVPDPLLMADDRDALDACARDGRTLAELVPRSPAREALVQLAQRVRAEM